MNKISPEDIQLFQSKGIATTTIETQIRNFQKGFPYASLVRPANPGDGIEVLDDKEVDALIAYFDTKSVSKKIIKFVPASGAASRMFKALFEFLAEADTSSQQDLIKKDKGFNSPWNFIQRIDKFAFLEDLSRVMEDRGFILKKSIGDEKYHEVISSLLNEHGLDYGSLPKGLLKFHDYPEGSRLAFEEHLVEAAQYAVSAGKIAYVHFTVSTEHLDRFKEKVNEATSRYAQKFGIRYDISYSVQKPSTDTIAVDMENNPFREEDSSILFRPGGHGALIENLGELDGDLVFIKNIDNVVPDRLKTETTRYKKAIGGLLLKLQSTAFDFLKVLEKGIPGEADLQAMATFASEELQISLPEDFGSYDNPEKAALLTRYLDRPIRICGMVKNEGEPGGGPFWVRNSRGEISLQIVESSQIDSSEPQQMDHLHGATHFNPVDLVCATKDYKGNPFDLHRFIDPQTGFISIKSKGGKELKAQELPGLWNGAMADWNTLFVEVPIITFNPVKTVNDLLRPQHQPQ